MAIARNVSAIVKVIEYAKLFCERVLVWCDVRAIHGDGGITVADAKIAEDLIVRTVFLDDVNHVTNAVFASRKRHAIRISSAGISFHDFFRVYSQMSGNIREWQSRQ